MLTAVFAECVTKLEPGGRIAVNVANLSRRPFRSLSADVVGILQDRLGLLLRGEVVWLKGRGAGGSCAWGSFQRPGNPVLRDLTERIVIASKGRFDRALTARQRHDQGRPSTATLFRDEFMEATTDLWELAPESATRVGHPAPFPVELPQRLIALYTYEGDLVLDPFVGSGTTAVAAVVVERAGFTEVRSDVRFPALGVEVSLVAQDATGRRWAFDVCGGFTTTRSGLRRSDTLWKALGKAAVLYQADPTTPLVLLTTDLPSPGSAGAAALRAVVGPGRAVHDVVELLSEDAHDRLRRHASGTCPP